MTNQKMNYKINLRSGVYISESESSATRKSNLLQMAGCATEHIKEKRWGERPLLPCWGWKLRSWVLELILFPERKFCSIEADISYDTTIVTLVQWNISFSIDILFLFIFKKWRRWVIRFIMVLNELLSFRLFGKRQIKKMWKEEGQIQQVVWLTGFMVHIFLGTNDVISGFPGEYSVHWVWSLAGGHSFSS